MRIRSHYIASLFVGFVVGLVGCGLSPAIEADGAPAGAGRQALTSATPWLDALRSRKNLVEESTITLLGRGDAASLFFLRPPALAGNVVQLRWPVVAFLQGGRTSRIYYREVGRALAAYGFVVVIPEHLRPFPTPDSPEIILSDPIVISEVVETMAALNADPESDLYRLVDTGRVGIAGHSIGGSIALRAMSGQCDAPWCEGPFVRPAGIAAGAFYGTDLIRPDGSVVPVETAPFPVAFLSGTADSRATEGEIARSFPELDGVRALVAIRGANHFSICDVDNPPGSAADLSTPTLGREEGIELIALWLGLFLRAHVLDDPIARYLVEETGGFPRGTVEVRALEGLSSPPAR